MTRETTILPDENEMVERPCLSGLRVAIRDVMRSVAFRMTLAGAPDEQVESALVLMVVARMTPGMDSDATTLCFASVDDARRIALARRPLRPSLFASFERLPAGITLEMVNQFMIEWYSSLYSTPNP